MWGRWYLGSVGKVDNGIVAVISLWASERCYWPVHAVPYTPASRQPGGQQDPGFRTKPQLARRWRDTFKAPAHAGGSSAVSATVQRQRPSDRRESRSGEPARC
jgi:hypothetical protein